MSNYNNGTIPGKDTYLDAGEAYMQGAIDTLEDVFTAIGILLKNALPDTPEATAVAIQYLVQNERDYIYVLQGEKCITAKAS